MEREVSRNDREMWNHRGNEWNHTYEVWEVLQAGITLKHTCTHTIQTHARAHVHTPSVDPLGSPASVTGGASSGLP